MAAHTEDSSPEYVTMANHYMPGTRNTMKKNCLPTKFCEIRFDEVNQPRLTDIVLRSYAAFCADVDDEEGPCFMELLFRTKNRWAVRSTSIINESVLESGHMVGEVMIESPCSVAGYHLQDGSEVEFIAVSRVFNPIVTNTQANTTLVQNIAACSPFHGYMARAYRTVFAEEEPTAIDDEYLFSNDLLRIHKCDDDDDDVNSISWSSDAEFSDGDLPLKSADVLPIKMYGDFHDNVRLQMCEFIDQERRRGKDMNDFDKKYEQSKFQSQLLDNYETQIGEYQNTIRDLNIKINYFESRVQKLVREIKELHRGHKEFVRKSRKTERLQMQEYRI